jgi:hypothetical protein
MRTKWIMTSVAAIVAVSCGIALAQRGGAGAGANIGGGTNVGAGANAGGAGANVGGAGANIGGAGANVGNPGANIGTGTNAGTNANIGTGTNAGTNANIGTGTNAGANVNAPGNVGAGTNLGTEGGTNVGAPGVRGGAELGTGANVTGENWRYRNENGRWWYWTPQNRWMYYDNGNWSEYPAQGYTANYAPEASGYATNYAPSGATTDCAAQAGGYTEMPYNGGQTAYNGGQAYSGAQTSYYGGNIDPRYRFDNGQWYYQTDNGWLAYIDGQWAQPREPLPEFISRDQRREVNRDQGFAEQRGEAQNNQRQVNAPQANPGQLGPEQATAPGQTNQAPREASRPTTPNETLQRDGTPGGREATGFERANKTRNEQNTTQR